MFNRLRSYKLRAHNGFTLLELLVTIAILITLTGIGIAGLSNYRQLNQLTLAADEVKDAILQAQTLAYSPTNENAEQYIVASLDQINYHLYAVVGSQSLEVKSFQLRTGTTFSSVPSGAILAAFKVPIGEVTSGGTTTLPDG